MSENILILRIKDVRDFTTDILSGSNLTKLLKLDFRKCTDIMVTKAGMKNLRELRQLRFFKSTVFSIEKGIFELLPNLKHFCLGIYLAHKKQDEVNMQMHIYRYHCSEEYLWLREYLTLHRNLLQGASEGEVFDVAGIKSYGPACNYLFDPINCSISNSYIIGS